MATLRRIARLAARTRRAPAAAVVIDQSDQRIVAPHGCTAEEAEAALDSLEPTFRTTDRALVVADTLADPRFDNPPPCVQGRALRFAAARWLLADDECGAIWVFDFEPRDDHDDERLRDMDDLASLLSDELATQRSNRHLEKAKRDIEKILDVMPDVLIFADPDRRITTVNRGFTDHFGYSASEAVGRTTEFLYAHPEMYGHTHSRYNPQAPDLDEPYHIEYRRKDGSTFLAQTIGVHVRDAHDRTLGYLGITKDVTEEVRLERERREALEKLRESEKLLRETNQLARIGGGQYYVATDELVWSDQLYRLHDLPVGQSLTMQETLEFFAPEDRRRLQRHVEQALDTGEPFELTLPMTTARDEPRWMRIKGSALVKDGKIIGVSGYHQDITEQKQAEQAKHEFISVVNHELRTPLTSIQATLDLLDHGVVGDLPDEAAELIEVAVRNTRRLGALIDDILDIEKIESGNPDIRLTRVDVGQLIDEIVVSNQRYARSFDVALQASTCEDGLAICADFDKLHQVLTNLVSNAVKFSPAEGVVDITASRVDSQTVRLAVRDRGPGIPEDFQERLFDKFTRADTTDARKRPGTGLGLHIAKSLTEAMGGGIGFETARGRGTTMCVDFVAAASVDPTGETPCEVEGR